MSHPSTKKKRTRATKPTASRFLRKGEKRKTAQLDFNRFVHIYLASIAEWERERERERERGRDKETEPIMKTTTATKDYYMYLRWINFVLWEKIRGKSLDLRKLTCCCMRQEKREPQDFCCECAWEREREREREGGGEDENECWKERRALIGSYENLSHHLFASSFQLRSSSWFWWSRSCRNKCFFHHMWLYPPSLLFDCRIASMAGCLEFRFCFGFSCPGRSKTQEAKGFSFVRHKFVGWFCLLNACKSWDWELIWPSPRQKGVAPEFSVKSAGNCIFVLGRFFEAWIRKMVRRLFLGPVHTAEHLTTTTTGLQTVEHIAVNGSVHTARKQQNDLHAIIRMYWAFWG